MDLKKHLRIRNLLTLMVLSAAALSGACSTDSATRKSAAAADPVEAQEYLSTAEVRDDPDRVICRRHKPTGSRISEKICMTARQWQQASDDSNRVLDKAQRTTGGLEAN